MEIIMKIFSVGPSDLNSDYELNKIDENLFEFVVYWYEDGGYDGNGQLVAFSKEKELHVYDLSHCSCYGPLEAWGNPVKMDVAEFLRPKDSVHDYEFKKLVESKVKELLEIVI
jgi:hypothetical protein